MTSASELFYNRRSRLSRDTVELGLDSSLDRNPNSRRHHHNHYGNNIARRDRLDLDGCDPLRRSPNHRHHLPPRSFNTEHESIRFDQFSRQSTLDNIFNSDNVSSASHGSRFSGNDRLPGPVVLARERLLQRLRGASLSSNRISSDVDGSDLTSGNDTALLVDGGNLETEMLRVRRPIRVAPFSYSDSISQTDMRMREEENRSKRAPGLTREIIESLKVEVFSDMKCKGGSSSSSECSICLESFIGGDEMIRLACGHGFHSCCLVPWVRTCGDCPYCRRRVAVL